MCHFLNIDMFRILLFSSAFLWLLLPLSTTNAGDVIDSLKFIFKTDKMRQIFYIRGHQFCEMKDLGRREKDKEVGLIRLF